MNRRRLGTTSLYVSEISFGCMSLDVQSKESEATLQKAFDAGINFFDTADLYDRGENEKLVGRALHSVREQVVIATKVGNQWREDGSGWDWNPTKEYIINAAEASLLRLGTDYIDLYQLHGGTINDPIDDSIEAFELLKKQGKIREYGISSIRPNVIREWVKRSNITSVMMQYSLLDRRPEEEMLEFLHKNDISVITRGTLGKGLLVGKPTSSYLKFSTSEVEKLQIEVLKSKNPLSTSIKFVLNHPAVASAVLGIRTKEQLTAILNSDLSLVNNQDLMKLSNVLPPLKYENHR